MSRIDTLACYSGLAARFNADRERLKIVGEADMDLVLVLQRDGGGAFCIRVVFEGLECVLVEAIDEDEVPVSDFRLVGPIAAWQAMFDDIATNGRATGLHTINSLALMGTDIVLVGNDVMGVDKFSRFNQTLQEYLDGWAETSRPSVAAAP